MASGAPRVESVRMYVISPTEPSSPSSTPSYRRCAIIIVRFTLKRSLREESCCNLLVVNGAAALRRRSFLSTDRTTHSAFSSAARIFSASSALETSIFSSPLPRSEEHTSELQSQSNLVCRLLLEKKKKYTYNYLSSSQAKISYC